MNIDDVVEYRSVSQSMLSVILKTGTLRITTTGWDKLIHTELEKCLTFQGYLSVANMPPGAPGSYLFSQLANCPDAE